MVSMRNSIVVDFNTVKSILFARYVYVARDFLVLLRIRLARILSVPGFASLRRKTCCDLRHFEALHGGRGFVGMYLFLSN